MPLTIPQVKGAGSSTSAKAKAPQKETMANLYPTLRPNGIDRPAEKRVNS